MTTLCMRAQTVANDSTRKDTSHAAQQVMRRPRGQRFDPQYPDVHDPVMAVEDGKYYIFATGMGINCMSSEDMKTWKMERPAFDEAPAWAKEQVNGYWGHTWAPDIIRNPKDGLWYMYYSCSTFGKNLSAIGVAVNKTLNPDSDDYKWVDRGEVLHSTPRVDQWNAIDPNVIIDEKGTAWMTWGSFWDGIQLVQLKDDWQTPVDMAQRKTIARRIDPKLKAQDRGGDNPVEAPFIIRRGKYYYLFVSFDYCCKGLNSTYKTAVGRSKNVYGPYLDSKGKDMANGGGDILVGADDEYAGVGHCSVYEIGGQWYIVAHGYDKSRRGASKLYIRPLEFDKKGWVKIKK